MRACVCAHPKFMIDLFRYLMPLLLCFYNGACLKLSLNKRQFMKWKVKNSELFLRCLYAFKRLIVILTCCNRKFNERFDMFEKLENRPIIIGFWAKLISLSRKINTIHFIHSPFFIFIRLFDRLRLQNKQMENLDVFNRMCRFNLFWA